MTTIVGLGIAVDSTPVAKAEAALNGMASAGGTAEKSVQGLEKATRSANTAIDEHTKKVKDSATAQKSAAEANIKAAAAGKSIANGVMLAIGVATAATAAAASAVLVLNSLVGKAAAFKDLGTKMGDTGENVASLATAAGRANVNMQQVVQTSVMLTQRLSGVEGTGKAAANAIKTLGFNVDAFKKLAPSDQLEAIAKAMAKWADGTEKTAIAQALFGRGGAEQLKFMKELGEQGGRQIILTQRQIDQAKAYTDQWDSLRTAIGLNAQAVAVQALPAFNAFASAIGEVLKELTGVTEESAKLGASSAIKTFAETSAIGLATLTDALIAAVQALVALKGSVDVVIADTGVALGWTKQVATAFLPGVDWDGQVAELQRNVDKRNKVLADANKSYAQLLSGAGLADKTRKAIDFQNSLQDPSYDEAERRRFGLPAKPALPKAPKLSSTGGRGSKDASREARELMNEQIAAVRDGGAKLQRAYDDVQKILNARRSMGLVDDKAYFTAQRSMIQLEADAKETAIKAELEILGKQKATGADAARVRQQQIKAESELLAARDNARTSLTLLDLQEQAYMTGLSTQLKQAERAGKDYLATMDRVYSRDIAAMIGSRRDQRRTAGEDQILDKYRAEREGIEREVNAITDAGREVTDFERANFDARLKLIDNYQAEALDKWRNHTKDLETLEADWTVGAARAIEDYGDTANNIAGQTADLFGNAFQGMEDALVQFVTTGKLSFADLANSIVADITRMIIKQMMFNAISGMMGGPLGIGLANMSSDPLGAFINLNGGFAGRASGGPVSAGNIYRVNEQGPELLNVAGKQYLMMGSKDGAVEPASAGQSAALYQTVNFYNNGPIDRRTQAQLGATTYAAAARMAARMN